MSNTLRILLIFLCFLSSCCVLHAQQTATIHGTLKDSTGNALPSATIVIVETSAGTYTDNNGRYSLDVPAGKKIKIVFSYLGFESDSVTTTLKPGEKREINSRLREGAYRLPEAVIKEQRLRDQNMIKLNPKMINNIPTPNGSVEDMLKTLPGVASTNELSSTYSVRGGNYDENLVYVNGIEVYRPFLVRSGQQEGLSFINSDMVEDIKFSAGGFDAIYGDKMSSVLDIKYRTPTKFSASANASLLGGSIEVEDINKAKTLFFLGGFRYKSDSYLLQTLDTKGEYKPSFSDLQFLTSYKPKGKFEFEFFGNYSDNLYTLVPSTRQTDFGTLNNAQRLAVYFQGQEIDSYETFVGAASVTFHQSNRIKHKLIFSGFKTYEEQNYDILGQYFLDQLETDLGKPTFGNVAFNLGVGSFLNHARDNLNATVGSIEYKGEIVSDKSLLQWGVKGQQEIINDKLDEWNYLDSAGFSVPTPRDSANPQLVLNNVIKNSIYLFSHRYQGYVQNTWQVSEGIDKIIITIGVRGNYSDLNDQLLISPRAAITYKPHWSKRLSLRASGGVYSQPPFYNELRDLEGNVHTDVKAQQSIQAVLGSDYLFLAWGREFKLTSEAYYKKINDLNPYIINDLRILYLAENNANGYATGIDFRLNGEFVPGIESWASLSFLKTVENINNYAYYVRKDSLGNTIIPGYSANQIATDSTRVPVGNIPRPTDQRVTFSMFFQDYLPKYPTYKMHLSLIFGTGIPFGPPGPNLYQDVLRTPPYKRVDIGFTKQIVGDDVTKPPHGKLLKKFESISISLDVYNLLDVSNTASYTWITDVTTARQYAVPNYLTARELNLKLQAKF